MLMRMGWGIAGSLIGLMVVTMGTIHLLHAQNLTPTAFLQMKQQIIRNDQGHHKQTKGAPYITGQIPGHLEGTGPQTTPNPQLVPAIPQPGSVTIYYKLSSPVYTDQVHWAVLTGSVANSPRTGVIIRENYQNNLQPNFLTIPNAGQITITGFKGTIISLQGSLGGTGRYNIATSTLSWHNE
ncbi:MAG: hypothetical protein C7B47_09675 [Sulfobacillus thermosulfidooxidans]|uniref:Uncharacterized protein n=1 Tax=Sulfobacillus thermosulfidooxidans TaxID=28034 RepID=A0A2T2WX83_SULTH|nr:MAG: hypothetical protein C7B47_09675 [Sulfobacillus thermosulfidooxidans]